MTHSRITAAILVSQFIVSLSALGMPPFFALLLERSFASQRPVASLAGILYVVPTLFAAVANPIWGHVADRIGKKPVLIRAQIGLAASFLIAGYSRSIWQFALALALQGILGGTFAASRAYLACFLAGPALAHALTLMEAAPRAALAVAPPLIGVLIRLGPPIMIYRYLAILPLLAAFLALRLPEPAGPGAPRMEAARKDRKPGIGPVDLFAAQFLFTIGVVVASPYFTSFVQTRFLAGSAGLLFGLPHLVYLLSSSRLSKLLQPYRPALVFPISILILAATLLGQAYAHSLIELASWRLAMGLAMTLGFIGIHGLISNLDPNRTSGSFFGLLDGTIRLSSVFGGIAASFAFQHFGLQAPMVLGSAILFFSSVYFANCKY
jgi:MFS family permease